MSEFGRKETIYSKVLQVQNNDKMSPLNPKVSLKHPQTPPPHTQFCLPFPSQARQGYPISGKEIEVQSSVLEVVVLNPRLRPHDGPGNPAFFQTTGPKSRTVATRSRGFSLPSLKIKSTNTQEREPLMALLLSFPNGPELKQGWERENTHGAKQESSLSASKPHYKPQHGCRAWV